MGNFGNDNKFGGSRGRGRSGGRDAGRRDSGPRTLYDATCSSCGDNCRVPFRPTNGKPVFCSNCFEKRDHENEDSRGPRRNNYDRPSYSKPSYNRSSYNKPKGESIDPKKFDALSAKVDRILEILETVAAQEDGS